MLSCHVSGEIFLSYPLRAEDDTKNSWGHLNKMFVEKNNM